MASDRKYDEKQVKEILRRAAERQSRYGDQDEDGGMSLEDLQRVAAEVGINPRHIEAVATELDRPVREKAARGSRSRICLQAGVQGHIDRAVLDEMTQEIRLHFGTTGEIDGTASNREWLIRQDFYNVSISASLVGEQTVLRIESRLLGPMLKVWLGVGMFAAFTCPLLFNIIADGRIRTDIAALVSFVYLLGLFKATSSWWKRWNQRERRKLETLMLRLHRIAERTTPPQSEHVEEVRPMEQRNADTVDQRPAFT